MKKEIMELRIKQFEIFNQYAKKIVKLIEKDQTVRETLIVSILISLKMNLFKDIYEKEKINI